MNVEDNLSNYSRMENIMSFRVQLPNTVTGEFYDGVIQRPNYFMRQCNGKVFTFKRDSDFPNWWNIAGDPRISYLSNYIWHDSWLDEV